MGSSKPSFVESKEPKAKVKPSSLGTKGNNTKAPKGSKESLKGKVKSPKRKGQAGH